MKIAVIGLGRVAMASALALARHHEVVMTGPLPDRVQAINSGTYGLSDPALDDYRQRHRLDLRAVPDMDEAISAADMIFVCTPRSSDPVIGAAGLAELENRIAFAAEHAASAPIVLRSAVPVGFCASMQERVPGARIVHAPEFCREGHMLSDILHPKFLIVGERGDAGRRVLDVLEEAALCRDIPTRQMGATEAEMTRHLSTLLRAARISYFNELDSYALHHGLDAAQIIDGVCLDPRIGRHVANPCFGFAHHGMSLSAQSLPGLLDPQRTPLLAALEGAETARTDMLVKKITEGRPDAVGLYNPDPSAPLHTALERIRHKLKAAGIRTTVNPRHAHDLAEFKAGSDIIIAMRRVPELSDVADKVFARDHHAT